MINRMRINKLIKWLLIFLCLIYVIFTMPLPFVSHIWFNFPSMRHRMICSLEDRVTGLTQDEIMSLLGNPASFGGVFTAPDRGLVYIIRNPRVRGVGVTHEFFIIFLDEELIAYDTTTMSG